jgi:hypothetical protein
MLLRVDDIVQAARKEKEQPQQQPIPEDLAPE